MSVTKKHELSERQKQQLAHIRDVWRGKTMVASGGAWTAEAREPQRKALLLKQLELARALRLQLEEAAASASETNTVLETARQLILSNVPAINRLVSLTEAVRGNYIPENYDEYIVWTEHERTERQRKLQSATATLKSQCERMADPTKEWPPRIQVETSRDHPEEAAEPSFPPSEVSVPTVVLEHYATGQDDSWHQTNTLGDLQKPPPTMPPVPPARRPRSEIEPLKPTYGLQHLPKPGDTTPFPHKDKVMRSVQEPAPIIDNTRGQREGIWKGRRKRRKDDDDNDNEDDDTEENEEDLELDQKRTPSPEKQKGTRGPKRDKKSLVPAHCAPQPSRATRPATNAMQPDVTISDSRPAAATTKTITTTQPPEPQTSPIQRRGGSKKRKASPPQRRTEPDYAPLTTLHPSSPSYASTADASEDLIRPDAVTSYDNVDGTASAALTATAVNPSTSRPSSRRKRRVNGPRRCHYCKQLKTNRLHLVTKPTEVSLPRHPCVPGVAGASST